MRHAQRGQRRAELVRHGGDQVVLQLVEAHQARHVLEHDRARRPCRPPRWRPASARGSRKTSCAPSAGAHRLLEPLRLIGALARPARGRARARSARAPPAAPAPSGSARRHGRPRTRRVCLGRAVHAEQAARRASSTSTGSGRLSMAACACCCACQQLAERAGAVLRQPVGHGVELARHLGDLVAARARARAPCGSPSPRRRAAWRSTDSGRSRRVVSVHRRQQPQRAGQRRGGEHDGVQALRPCSRALALAHHGVLVDGQDLVGRPA